MTIGMCLGLVVLVPRGEVSESSKTSVGDDFALVSGAVQGLSPSRSAAWGEDGGCDPVSARARLWEASAFADKDFWCFFAGFQDFFGECCCFLGVPLGFSGEVLTDESPLPDSF